MDLSSLLGFASKDKNKGGESKSAPFKKRRVRHPKKIVKGGMWRKGAPPASAFAVEVDVFAEGGVGGAAGHEAELNIKSA